PRDVVGLFVNPDHSGELLNDFFHQLMSLVVGIGLEIEDQNILTSEAFAAGGYELADAPERLDAGIVVILVLFFLLLGFFFLCFLLFVRSPKVFDFFLSFLVFLALLFFAERPAIFSG